MTAFRRAALAVCLAAQATGPAHLAGAAGTEPPEYLNPDLPMEARAADLVSRMTAEEKAAQLLNDAPAIPRLGVPAYNWWNECLHGVARAGVATVFPQAIGLAASFDTRLMTEVATATANEGRAKHHEFVRRGERTIYKGLTFWSPNINIFRDPRWGRGHETYGEDPYLTGRMGVAFVRALQGDDPRYYKVIATAKHFAVHSGPEPERHHFDAVVGDRDLYDTYLPAFRALVQDAKVASVMGAYNRVNGESASASQRLLLDILRRDWGFTGYVVSDCAAIEDIHKNHKIVATEEEAAALGVKKGCDLECGKAYLALPKALQKGLLTEKDLDVALTRLLWARLKLGMFDPPERVPYARIPYEVNDSPGHDALARRMAQASLVLLKNEGGVLPLRQDLKTIAVVGPTADSLPALLGNYFGTPSRPVTVLAGIRKAASPGTKVVYARGADLVEGRQDPRAAEPIPASALRPEAASTLQGLKGEYYKGRELAGTPVHTRVDSQVDFRWDRGAPTDDLVRRGELTKDAALDPDEYSVRWTGQLVPPRSGTYEINVSGDDGYRLFVDGKPVIDEWTEHRVNFAKSANVALEEGKPVDVKLEYFEVRRDAEVRLGWRLPGAKTPLEEAVDAAKASDAVVFVGGLTAEVEGEEMRVEYPGFRGGDRTDLQLPGPQQKLLAALHATGKPVVAVLTTGSSITLGAVQDTVPAILVAWYPGQQGGTAVADVLFGDVSPAGRLPVTFYKSVDQLPPFVDYAMDNRTYRYFKGEPLYPFGHGLSYGRFEYAPLQLEKPAVPAKERTTVSLKVKNVGDRDAEEVVQLYVRPLNPRRPSSIHELRGFERVSLKKGEEKLVTFRLTPQSDLASYDVAVKAYVVDPGEYELQAGASSRDLRQRATLRVQ
jgi:beta-glucosidase